MFLIHSGSPTADAPRISGVDLGTTLGATFRLALLARGINGQQTPSDYSFYDWELNPVQEQMKVCEIPTPGIVVAIRKGLGDRPEVLAGQVKYHLTWLEKDTLDSFLKDPSTQFVPSTLGGAVAEAVEAKPGLFGFTVDLKKLFKAVFNRGRSKP